MRYIIFVIDSVSNSGTGDEMAEIDEFNERLQRDGHWVTAAGIGAPGTATLIDNRDGVGSISDDSLFDGPDFYSGFWIIDVPDGGVAETLALAGSRACNRRVELRPYL
jgi:hypothetical protein